MNKVEPKIIKGKLGGWRPNSGRKPGFVGYWTGKKRPYIKGNPNIALYGQDYKFTKLNSCAELHPRWKGGSWLYWKTKALERDNFTCQKCGLHEPEVMQVDHIIPRKILKKTGKEIISDLNNLQTLCANCHIKKTNKEKREGAKSKNFYRKYD